MTTFTYNFEGQYKYVPGGENLTYTGERVWTGPDNVAYNLAQGDEFALNEVVYFNGGRSSTEYAGFLTVTVEYTGEGAPPPEDVTFFVLVWAPGFGDWSYSLFGNVDSAVDGISIFAHIPLSIPQASINTGNFPLCFLAGTGVATPAGSTAIEDLVVGDLVLTVDGRAVPIRWIGVQTVVSLFADPLRSFPVRITAGALDEGLPVRDLLVSPDHALMLDGVLVQAGALVNGASITRTTEMPERFTYYHLELDAHALILAEGVAAETFVDNVTRRRFDNFAEYAARFGDAGATIAEMDLPRVKSARQLPKAMREKLGIGPVPQARHAA